LAEIDYRVGIPEALRQEAAALYDEAFGAKLALAVPDREKRVTLLGEALDLQYGIAAIKDGRLVGLAGFRTLESSLTGGIDGRWVVQQLGILEGLRAITVFALYERKLDSGALLMDGIAVRADQRGQGIGSRLLDEIKRYAADNGFSRVRLDVIDTNPGARRLYERQGFVATHTERFEYLRRVLGFGAATAMEFWSGEA
jgi:ribosomal protein S18 acetylase RimI-like enzyme